MGKSTAADTKTSERRVAKYWLHAALPNLSENFKNSREVASLCVQLYWMLRTTSRLLENVFSFVYIITVEYNNFAVLPNVPENFKINWEVASLRIIKYAEDNMSINSRYVVIFSRQYKMYNLLNIAVLPSAVIAKLEK